MGRAPATRRAELRLPQLGRDVAPLRSSRAARADWRARGLCAGRGLGCRRTPEKMTGKEKPTGVCSRQSAFGGTAAGGERKARRLLTSLWAAAQVCLEACPVRGGRTTRPVGQQRWILRAAERAPGP